MYFNMSELLSYIGAFNDGVFVNVMKSVFYVKVCHKSESRISIRWYVRSFGKSVLLEISKKLK